MSTQAMSMVSQILRDTTPSDEEPVRNESPPAGVAMAPDAIGIQLGLDFSSSMEAYHKLELVSVRTLTARILAQLVGRVPVYLCETVMSGPPQTTGFQPAAEFEPCKGEWGYDSPFHLLLDDISRTNRKFVGTVKGRVSLINIITFDGKYSGCTPEQMADAIKRFQAAEREMGSHTFVAELPGSVTAITRAVSATHEAMPLPDADYGKLFDAVFALALDTATDADAPAKMSTIERQKTRGVEGS